MSLFPPQTGGMYYPENNSGSPWGSTPSTGDSMSPLVPTQPQTAAGPPTGLGMYGQNMGGSYPPTPSPSPVGVPTGADSYYAQNYGGSYAAAPNPNPATQTASNQVQPGTQNTSGPQIASNAVQSGQPILKTIEISPPPATDPADLSPLTPFQLATSMEISSSKRAQAAAFSIIATLCLDIAAIVLVFMSCIGLVLQNKTLAWDAYINGTYGTGASALRNVSVYTGIWGQCIVAESGSNLSESTCAIFFSNTIAATLFGRTYVQAMPILSIITCVFLVVAPCSSYFPGRQSFSFAAGAAMIANATWIASFTMMLIFINRKLPPYITGFQQFYYGVGYYLGCVATGLMFLSFLVKVVALLRFNKAETESKQAAAIKAEAVAASTKTKQQPEMTMTNGEPAGTPAVAATAALGAGAAVGMTAATSQYDQGHVVAVDEYGQSSSDIAEQQMTAFQMAADQAAQQQAFQNMASQSYAASMGAFQAQANQSNAAQWDTDASNAGATYNVAVQNQPGASSNPGVKGQSAFVQAANTSGISNLGLGYAQDQASVQVLSQPQMVASQPAPNQMQNSATKAELAAARVQAQMATAALQQPPSQTMQPQQPPTPSAYLASLPPDLRMQIEGQIQSQLATYAQPIADYVRGTWPTATPEQQQQAYAHYLGQYREGIEAMWANWVASGGQGAPGGQG